MARSADRSARLSKKCKAREEEGAKSAVFISRGRDPGGAGGFECVPKGCWWKKKGGESH